MLKTIYIVYFFIFLTIYLIDIKNTNLFLLSNKMNLIFKIQII